MFIRHSLLAIAFTAVAGGLPNPSTLTPYFAGQPSVAQSPSSLSDGSTLVDPTNQSPGGLNSPPYPLSSSSSPPELPSAPKRLPIFGHMCNNVQNFADKVTGKDRVKRKLELWLTFDAMMRNLAQEKTPEVQVPTTVPVKSNRGQELELTADNPAPIPSQSIDGYPWLQKDAACIAESVVLQECVRYVWNYYQSYYEGAYAKRGYYHPLPMAVSLQYYGQFSLKQCVEEHLSYRPTRVIFQKTAETVDKPSGYSMRLSTSELVLSCSAFDAYWDINDGQYYFQAIRGDTWYTVVDNALMPRADLGSNLSTRVRLDPEFWYTSSLHDVDAGQLADSSPGHQLPQETIIFE